MLLAHQAATTAAARNVELAYCGTRNSSYSSAGSAVRGVGSHIRFMLTIEKQSTSDSALCPDHIKTPPSLALIPKP